MNTWFPNDPMSSQSLESWLDERQGSNEPPDEPRQEREYIRYIVGADLGKLHDPSTVAVVEVQYAPDGSPTFFVKYLKRFTLRMRYSNVAVSIGKVENQLKSYATAQGKGAEITIILDATGVGESVAELVKDELSNADIYKCYITGGINPKIDYETHTIHLPKGQMVSTMVALFDSKHLFFSKHSKEIEAMKNELMNFEINISEETGRETYSARTGAHDDLLIAVGLAVLLGSQESMQPIRIW